MAGSKRSLRASTARRGGNKSSTDNKTSSSKKKKNTAAGRRGRRGEDEDNDDTVKKSLYPDTKNSPLKDDEKKMSAALSDGDNTSSNEEDANNTNDKDPPPKKRAKKEQDGISSSKPPPPQPPSKQPVAPPAKIKGRFIEVKMKQLTSYFTSRTSGNKKAPAPPVSTSQNGGEDNPNTTRSSAWKKRSLATAGEDAAIEENKNLKKRRVNNEDNDDDDDSNEDGGINTNSDQHEKADRTHNPDTPKKQPIGNTKDEVGESPALESNTTTTNAAADDAAVACPLHFLADAVIMSPDVKKNVDSKMIDGAEEITPMPKIISDLNDADEAFEEKDGDRGESKKPAADGAVDTSIGESTEGEEGGESVNGTKCPETSPTTDVAGEGGSDPQIPNQDQSSCSKDDSLPQKIEEGESSTPVALDDVVAMDKPSQSLETTSKTETTLDEGDAAMDVDEVMERNPKEEQPQHAEDSTNAVINDAPHPQVSAAGTATTSTPPKSSNNNCEEESNTTTATKITPSVSQLKMALFLEASRIHAVGSGKPERIFAKYWDALETYIIASPSHHFVTTRSDPSLQFNTMLKLFLKTRKMKRLHNKLILALIKDSVREHVPISCSGGDCIPRAWRNRTRQLQQRTPEDDGVKLDDSGSIDSLRENWKTTFGNNVDTWSACGNGVMVAPRIDQTEFVAKKREEKEVEEEVSDEEIIPSCRLPGALGTDLFVKKIASDAGLTVSHDSMWMLIVAAREYTSTIIGKAINNDRYVTSGQTSRIPKSDYLSLSCEHLLVDKKKGKKKDAKKKESASKVADTSQGTTERNEFDKKRKVLNCADISQVLNDEQHVAAPRLAWMRSLGRGAAHHQHPNLQTTNDMINTSIQRAAIESRQRTADRKILDGRNVVPAAVAEENLHDKSMVGNERLDRGGRKEEKESERKVEAAIEKRPSINMNDSATKAPPKSSDLLKSNAPTTKPTTESSAAPSQSGLSQSVDSTATTAPATENVTQIRQVRKSEGKNLASMKAKRSGSLNKVRREPEPTAAKQETPERLVRYQGQATGPATQSPSQQSAPAPAPISVTNLSAPAPAPTPTSINQQKGETPERLVRFQSQAARLATQSLPQQTTLAPTPASVTNLSTPAPISTNQRNEETPERLVRFQSQSAGPVNQPVLQQTAPVPVTNLYAPAPISTNQNKDETPERLVRFQSQAAGSATHFLPQQTAPVSVTKLSATAPIMSTNQSKDTEKLARYHQAAGPLTETTLQQFVHAPTSVTDQSAGLEEREKLIQPQYRQQQHKPHATSNTTQLWQETEMTMQSQVEQDEEEEVLPQPKLARTTNQL